MKKLIAGLLIVITMTLVPVACASKSTAPGPISGANRGAPAVTTTATLRPAITTTTSAAYDSTQTSVDRMVVRTGNIRLSVNDVSATLDKISELAKNLEGYVISSNKWQENERLVGTITVRVPAGRFEETIRTLRGLAVQVISESTTSQDVTEEYVDLDSKLKNLVAAEKQLLSIMEKATSTKDVLDVQRELTSVRGQIEQAKGRMQYLERTTSTSLIEVRLEESKLQAKFTASRATVSAGEKVQFSGDITGGIAPYSYLWDFGDGKVSTERAPAHAYNKPGSYNVTLKVSDDKGGTYTETRDLYINVVSGWNIGSTASGAWHGLVVFGRVLATIGIWLAFFSPVWLIGGGIIYWRRRRRKQKA